MGYMQAVFQFHYGAIKTNGVEDCIGAAFCFNSIMVRLRRLLSLKPPLPTKYFNSIMVRLRPTYTIGHLYNVTEFQFHYGTIKTSARLVDKLMLQAFQFHYGTIKTTARRHCRRHVSYFNSIMVRLRPVLLRAGDGCKHVVFCLQQR